jgi:hypothetical protein
MTIPRRAKPLVSAVPALTPQAINDLSDETKVTALEFYIRNLKASCKKQGDTNRTLKTELALCQRDNATLRSLLVPMLPGGESR